MVHRSVHRDARRCPTLPMAGGRDWSAGGRWRIIKIEMIHYIENGSKIHVEDGSNIPKIVTCPRPPVQLRTRKPVRFTHVVHDSGAKSAGTATFATTATEYRSILAFRGVNVLYVFLVSTVSARLDLKRAQEPSNFHPKENTSRTETHLFSMFLFFSEIPSVEQRGPRASEVGHTAYGHAAGARVVRRAVASRLGAGHTEAPGHGSDGQTGRTFPAEMGQTESGMKGYR